MKRLRIFLAAVAGVEISVAGVLFAWRLNSTLPIPPPVDVYTDAITGGELLAAPRQFPFDGVAKWRTLGEMYMTCGFFAKAEACLQRAVASSPRSAEIALSHGYCLERLGMLDEARDEFRRAAEQGGQHDAETAWYRLGRIYLQLEQPEEAATAFEKAGDDHAAGVYQRARLLIHGNRVAQAQLLLARLAETNPDDLLVWRLRLHLAEATGQTSAASQARDAAERAVVTLQLDDAHAQLASARAAFGFDRKLATALAAKEAGKMTVAAERLMELAAGQTRWWNRYPTFLEQVAETQLEAGNVAAASSFLERQIEQFGIPTARALQLQGAVEFLEGNSERAWQDWRRSESMQPGDIDHVKLARIAEQEGDDASARRHLGLGRQFAAIDAFRNNKLHEARSGLRQALSVEPGLPDAWFYLGETERLLGAQAAAQDAYQRCLKLNPCHGRARVRVELSVDQE